MFLGPYYFDKSVELKICKACANSLIAFMIFSNLDFQQFNCDMPKCGFLCIFPYSGTLSF